MGTEDSDNLRISIQHFVDSSFNTLMRDYAEWPDEDVLPMEARLERIRLEIEMFYYRFAQIFIANSQEELVKELGEFHKGIGIRSMELSIAFDDLSIEQLSIFLSLYNPEDSTDVFGCLASAITFDAEKK